MRTGGGKEDGAGNIRRIRRMSLHKRLKLFACGILVPFCILILYLIYALESYGAQYNRIVDNITGASVYNIGLREDIDYSLYRMIIGFMTAEEFAADGEYRNPYKELAEAREAFSGFENITTGPGNRQRVKMILKNLDTLERRIREIEETCTEPGSYDKNMVRLENNIHILTELLQENIQNYIYYETLSLKDMRAQLSAQVERALHISIISFAVVSAAAALLSSFMARSVSKPIEELCLVTEQAAAGDFGARAEGSAGDEIAVLSDSFNSMIGKIGDLVENIRQEQLRLRDTELKLLQAQINPHFLYNTLDTIVWLAEDKQNDQVVTMVTALSEFFRTTLSEGRDFITIREEETHIRSYLQIQQLRYRDILEYEIHIPEELSFYKIMKLTVQPLVENALYHGIKNKRGMGRIVVTAALEGEKVRISVEDNGIGMTPEALEELLLKIEQPAESRLGGFGLANVNERIRLNYGPEYGLSLESVYGKGTRAQVTVPAEKNVPES